jgi:tol-pal system protein YbgF
LTVAPAIAAVVIFTSVAASAQDGGQLAFLDRIFGNSERVSPSAAPPSGTGASPPPAAAQDGRVAQASPSELTMRINRLEAQVRELTGVIEQLQYRNRQLEARLRSSLGSTLGGAEPGAPPAMGMPSAAAPAASAMPPISAPPMSAPVTAAPGARGDLFDPARNPTAPGAPRVLGSIPSAAPPPAVPDYQPGEPVGAPGGRDAGAPLDLSTLAAAAAGQPEPPRVGDAVSGGQLPPPPPRTLSATGAQVATLPPTDSPNDNYDLAYGYILRKDYALAETGFRHFISRFPGDRLASDAHYWLGESLFQRQRFRDAAESFLSVSTKYETSAKAPDALLRLGQSLAALGEKEAACASLAEVLRKYPRASVGVRQGVDREQKRVRC